MSLVFPDLVKTKTEEGRIWFDLIIYYTIVA